MWRCSENCISTLLDRTVQFSLMWGHFMGSFCRNIAASFSLFLSFVSVKVSRREAQYICKKFPLCSGTVRLSGLREVSISIDFLLEGFYCVRWLPRRRRYPDSTPLSNQEHLTELKVHERHDSPRARVAQVDRDKTNNRKDPRTHRFDSPPPLCPLASH